jgi:hypothetical protein
LPIGELEPVGIQVVEAQQARLHKGQAAGRFPGSEKVFAPAQDGGAAEGEQLYPLCLRHIGQSVERGQEALRSGCELSHGEAAHGRVGATPWKMTSSTWSIAL